MTSRELYERVGGFRESRKHLFWQEEAAYQSDIAELGYGAAVLSDLKVHHTGGPHYTATSTEKERYWAQWRRSRERKDAVKRMLLRVPFLRQLNVRFGVVRRAGLTARRTLCVRRAS